jgi:hypothetical protein
MPTAQSLDISIAGEILTEAIFNEQQHFRDRGVTERDPLTGNDTGLTARQIIEADVAVHGWPWIGIAFSGSGGLVPHVTIHRSKFPSQTGNPEQRAEKLQNDLQAALESIYKTQQTIDDPTDPDFGQTVDIRNFWPAVHIWNYRADNLYVLRSLGSGDYRIIASADQPTPDWWQQFS